MRQSAVRLRGRDGRSCAASPQPFKVCVDTGIGENAGNENELSRLRETFIEPSTTVGEPDRRRSDPGFQFGLPPASRRCGAGFSGACSHRPVEDVRLTWTALAASVTVAPAAISARAPGNWCGDTRRRRRRAGEHEATRHGFRLLLEMGCADILQPDVGWCGRITELARISALADAHGKLVIPHGSSVYSYHFVVTRHNSPFAEFLMMAPGADEVVPMFTPGYQHPRGHPLAQVGVAPVIVRGEGFLDPAQPQLARTVRQPRGVVKVEGHPTVPHQPEFVPDAIPHLRELLEVGGQPRLSLRRAVLQRHLAAQEPQLLGHVWASTGGVKHELVAHRAPEQCVDRLLTDLPEQVPQRQIDPADRVEDDALAAIVERALGRAGPLGWGSRPGSPTHHRRQHVIEVCERGRDGLRGADVGDGALGPSTVGEQLQGDLVHSGRADVHRARDQPSSARRRATTRPIPRGAPTPVTTAVRSCWKVVMSTLIGVSLMCPAGSGSWGGGCDAPCRAGLRSQLPSSPSAPGLPRWTAARRRSPRIPRRRVLRSR